MCNLYSNARTVGRGQGVAAAVAVTFFTCLKLINEIEIHCQRIICIPHAFFIAIYHRWTPWREVLWRAAVKQSRCAFVDLIYISKIRESDGPISPFSAMTQMLPKVQSTIIILIEPIAQNEYAPRSSDSCLCFL